MAGPQIALPLRNDLTLRGQALLEANFAYNELNNYGVGDLVFFTDNVLYRALMATPQGGNTEPGSQGDTQ